MLTGRYASSEDRPISETDFRACMQPRFQPGNIESNLKLVDAIKGIAAQKGCVAAQVALAWVLGHGDHVVAIPGTTKLSHLRTNLGALECHLTDENRAELDALADQVLGDRYLPDGMAGVNQYYSLDRVLIVESSEVRAFDSVGRQDQRCQPECFPLSEHE